MRVLFFTALLFALPAHAEMTFGGAEVGKPQGMMVSGSSVIDDETPAQTAQVQEVRDDANDMMEGKKGAPPIEDIDPFDPAPNVETPKNVKRVLKKNPVAKAERSIADERIDDGYVQKMIRNNLDFTNPIE